MLLRHARGDFLPKAPSLAAGAAAADVASLELQEPKKDRGKGEQKSQLSQGIVHNSSVGNRGEDGEAKDAQITNPEEAQRSGVIRRFGFLQHRNSTLGRF